MRYRDLRCLNRKVSEISLGTGDNAGGLILGSKQEQRQLVASALDGGVNCFDSSPAYGGGIAETNLGRALREVGAGEVIVTTKVKVTPRDFDRITIHVRESLEESLQRLQRDRLDVVLIIRERYWRGLSRLI